MNQRESYRNTFRIRSVEAILLEERKPTKKIDVSGPFTPESKKLLDRLCNHINAGN
jgi:hypothetical protein